MGKRCVLQGYTKIIKGIIKYARERALELLDTGDLHKLHRGSQRNWILQSIIGLEINSWRFPRRKRRIG